MKILSFISVLLFTLMLLGFDYSSKLKAAIIIDEKGQILPEVEIITWGKMNNSEILPTKGARERGIINHVITTSTTSTTSELKLKFVWLTEKHWEELEKITTKGVSTVALVSHKNRWNIMQEVQYTHKDIELSEQQLAVLNKILNKY